MDLGGRGFRSGGDELREPAEGGHGHHVEVEDVEGDDEEDGDEGGEEGDGEVVRGGDGVDRGG